MPPGVGSAPTQSAVKPTSEKQSRHRTSSHGASNIGNLVPVRVVGDMEPMASSMATGQRRSAPIEIAFRHGIRVRVEHSCDLSLLQRVLAALENRPC